MTALGPQNTGHNHLFWRFLNDANDSLFLTAARFFAKAKHHVVSVGPVPLFGIICIRHVDSNVYHGEF